MISIEFGRKLFRRFVILRLRFNRIKRVIVIGLERVGVMRGRVR